MLKYVTYVELNEEEGEYTELLIGVADLDDKWQSGAKIGKGTKISCTMGHKKHKAKAFSGKISMITAEYQSTGYNQMEIKCIDKASKLMEKEKTITHKNKKISDIIKSMHKAAGIDIEVDDSKEVIAHVPQKKEKDSEFIRRWKKKLGWYYYKLPNEKYYFGEKPYKKQSKVFNLGYKTGGLEIISFSPTFIDPEDDNSKEKNTESKKGKTKKSDPKKTTVKTSSSKGSHKTSGKA